MPDNPHPLWRQDRCEWCKAGWRLSADGRHINGHAPVKPCTAPTEAEYIAQLEAKVASMESIISRLGGCICSQCLEDEAEAMQPAPPAVPQE